MSQLLGQAFRYRLLLRVKGLGYKAYIADNGSVLNLKLGYSHIVRFKFNKFMLAAKLGVKDRMFSVEGPEWVMLTNVVARIMSLRKVDVYRGKGIFKKFQSYKVRVGRKKKNNANKFSARSRAEKKISKKTRSVALRKRPQRKGVCLRVLTMSPKKPNSAVRKIAKVRFFMPRARITAHIPGIGHNIQKHSQVLVVVVGLRIYRGLNID
eukprot:UN02286